jgi:uncharacterized RDD family membrane protein YckC
MNCPNHPDVTADQVCSSCGKSFCKDCVIEIGGQILCAPCKEEKIRDMKSGTVGPDLASPWARLGAMLVDGLVFLPVTLSLFYYFTFVKGDTTIFQDFVPRMVLPAVLWVIYEWQMLAHGGQTLGKKALGIKVIAEDGGELTDQPLKRALSRQVCSLTQVLGIVDIFMIFTEKRRTLHDRFAKTLVIYWKR